MALEQVVTVHLLYWYKSTQVQILTAFGAAWQLLIAEKDKEEARQVIQSL